ncbi:hypothetical protein QSH57_005018 [Fusarium oxysporum f. sp. vasinfectum]|nr:hypothetical protein QSH57_005018 [Fusarium oxysporum f. sp. vasinfectum]
MTSSQTTAASTPSISDQPITGTSLDFFLLFKATYPDEDTQNTTVGSCTRKSRGMVMYRCLHCPADKPWANRKRDNAWHHARRCHADIISFLDRTLIGGSSDVLDDEREVLGLMVSFPLVTRMSLSAVFSTAIEDLLVTNRSALMRLIDATYGLYSLQLMATLEASISKIHILSDLWTSPHRHEILAISARWVDKDYQPRRALLPMPECRYSHSGETQASLIIDTLANIPSRVFKEALIAALDAADATSNDQLFARFYDTLHDAGQTTRTEEAHQRRRASRGGNRIYLRTSPDGSISRPYGKELQDDILLASEWEFIERTHRFLQPFASATLLAEGARSTLSQSLSIMDVLLRQYEKYKELYSSKENHDPYIVHYIDMGWFVLNKDYTLSDQAPVYAAALLLDSSKRRKYIDRNWQESWHAPAIAAAQKIWLDEYNAAPIPESLRVPLDVPSSSGRQRNELDELLSDIAVTGPILDDADDLYWPYLRRRR